MLIRFYVLRSCKINIQRKEREKGRERSFSTLADTQPSFGIMLFSHFFFFFSSKSKWRRRTKEKKKTFLSQFSPQVFFFHLPDGNYRAKKIRICVLYKSYFVWCKEEVLIKPRLENYRYVYNYILLTCDKILSNFENYKLLRRWS